MKTTSWLFGINGAALCCFGRRSVVRFSVILGAFLLAADSRGEGTITITFEGPPTQPSGTIYAVTNYIEGGTEFMGYFGRARPADGTGWPGNGTTYIQPDGGVACSRDDNIGFRLVSVDLAGYSVVIPDFPASFEGHRSDGSVLTTNFAVSGLAFQTYYFGPEFAELTNMLVTAGALDNLVAQMPSIPPALSVYLYRYGDYRSVRVHAEGITGLHYRLEYSDLSITNWVTASTFQSSTIWSETLSPTSPAQRFFRAVELP